MFINCIIWTKIVVWLYSLPKFCFHHFLHFISEIINTFVLKLISSTIKKSVQVICFQTLLPIRVSKCTDICRYIYNKIAQRIPRSSEWRKKCWHLFTIINLCLFFRSYELLLVKKRDTFSYFHFYRSQLLFYPRYVFYC